MGISKIQETLWRIQQEAKQKVAAARYGSQPSPPKPSPPKPSLEDALVALRENITTAVAQAISTKAARRYISDLSEKVQELASAAVANVQADNDFGTTAQDERGLILYPNNCKLLVLGNNGFGSLVIEEQPQFRTLYGAGGKTHRVPMPYVVFMIGFRCKERAYNVHGFGVGFCKEPLSSVDQHMLLPRLPHTQGNTHVCQPLVQKNYRTVKDLAEGCIQVFWNTAFHYDFGRNLCVQDSKFLFDGKVIASFEGWERIGRKNQLDILRGNFGRGETVRSVLKSFGQIETRDRNTANNRIQGAVARMVTGVNEAISSEELAELIRSTAEEIVNAALQNAVGNSALQPVEAVV